MMTRDSSKYDVSRSRVSSGSRPSESAANPTRSANRTDTTRRSAAGAGTATGAGGDAGTAARRPAVAAPAAKGGARRPQNFAVGSFAPPHEGALTARGAGQPREK